MNVLLLGDYVWYDVNLNDLIDDIENGLNGIEVKFISKF